MTEISNEAKKEFEEWLDGRPDVIQKMAVSLKPWFRYRLKPTGQHCSLYSYFEDGTVTITVDGHDTEALDMVNKVMPVNVFGISPDDLEIIES